MHKMSPGGKKCAPGAKNVKKNPRKRTFFLGFHFFILETT